MCYLNLRLQRSNNPTLSDEVPEILEATDQINTICEDERFIPIGNWRGDIGKLVSFFLYLIYLTDYEYQKSFFRLTFFFYQII